MTRISTRTIIRLCSFQTVCWIVGAFAIMHFGILPAARKELSVQSGHYCDLGELVVWNPESLPKRLSEFDGRDALLYTTTELSTGIVDTVLAFLACCVVLGFLMIRFRASRAWMRLMILPVLAAVADLAVTVCLVYLINTTPETVARDLVWIRVIAVIQVLAYAGALLGCAVLILRHVKILKQTASSINRI